MPFIIVVDTICEGRVSAFHDEDGKPSMWATAGEALGECWDEDDDVLEVVVEPNRIYDPIDDRTYWESV